MEIDPDARCDYCTNATSRFCEAIRKSTRDELNGIDAMEFDGIPNGGINPTDAAKAEVLTRAAESLGRLGCEFKLAIIIEQLRQY
jgi:hypothetical protein